MNKTPSEIRAVQLIVLNISIRLAHSEAVLCCLATADDWI